MKILIMMPKNSHCSFLIIIRAAKLKREIRNLISRRKHSLAMATVLSKGRFEREVIFNEIHDVKADLLLSENRASWDLVNRK